MRHPRISDLIAILLFLVFVCGSILIIRKHEQKQQNFPVWKTIEIGPYQNADAFRKNLKSKGYEIEYWANDILTVFDKRVFITDKLNLVLVSSGQFGFTDWVPYQEIMERARELGLKLTPPEAGPQLRLQYKDQPKNEWLHVAMEPLIASDGDPTVFDVMHNDYHAHDGHDTHSQHSLQLCSSSVHHNVLWSPSSKWVFAAN